MADPVATRTLRNFTIIWWGLTCLLILAALVLRSYHLDFGLPQRLHPDEASQVEVAWRIAQGDPNPHFFRYPSLMMYLLAGVYKIASLVNPPISLPSLYLTGRLVSAILGVGTVILVLVWGSLVWDRWAALVGAALYVVFTSPVLHAHYATVDTLMVFWSTASLVFISLALLRKDQRWILLAAVCAGLAAGSKYNAAILFLPLLLSSILLPARQRCLSRTNQYLLIMLLLGLSVLIFGLFSWLMISPQTVLDFFNSLTSDGVLEGEYLKFFQAGRWLLAICGLLSMLTAILIWRRPAHPIWPRLFNTRHLLVMVIILVTFGFTSPFVWIEWRQAAQDFFYEVRHMQIGARALLPVDDTIAASPDQSILPSALSVLNLFWSELGLAGILMAMIGGCQLFRKDQALFIVLVLYALLLVLTVSGWRNWSPRYILALFPLAAFLVAGGWQWVKARLSPGLLRISGMVLLTCLLFAGPVWVTRSSLSNFALPDTRELALSWLIENIQPESIIVRDSNSPDLDMISNDFISISAITYVLDSFTTEDLIKMNHPVVVTSFPPSEVGYSTFVTYDEFKKFTQVYRLVAYFKAQIGQSRGKSLFIYQKR